MSSPRLFHWALLGFLLSVGVADSREVVAADPLRLSAMTFNIRMSRARDGEDQWEHRKGQVVEVIRRFGGDFVGTQEAWAEQVVYLRQQLSDYQVLARSRQADPNTDEAVPLLYRQQRWQLDPQEHGTFWLSDTPETAGSRTFGNQLPRIVTWGRFLERPSGRGVYVYNTHFDHASEPARAKSAILLARRIVARLHAEPAIVLGDFNASQTSEPIRYLTGEMPDAPLALVDTFRALHADCQEVGTFHGFRGDKTGRKIDFVLALGPVRAQDARILHDQKEGRYPSDHFPVTATLEFPATGGH